MPGTCQAAEHDLNNPNYLICPKSLMAQDVTSEPLNGLVEINLGIGRILHP